MMTGELTGSIPTIIQALLCSFLMARESPVMVPPVPAPAIRASTFPEEGLEAVEGVDVTD